MSPKCPVHDMYFAAVVKQGKTLWYCPSCPRDVIHKAGCRCQAPRSCPYDVTTPRFLESSSISPGF